MLQAGRDLCHCLVHPADLTRHGTEVLVGRWFSPGKVGQGAVQVTADPARAQKAPDSWTSSGPLTSFKHEEPFQKSKPFHRHSCHSCLVMIDWLRRDTVRKSDSEFINNFKFFYVAPFLPTARNQESGVSRWRWGPLHAYT